MQACAASVAYSHSLEVMQANLVFSCYLAFYRAMLCIRGTIAVGLCPSVSVSVCHKSVFYRNGLTNRAGFWHVNFLPPVLHCVKRKFGYLQK